MVRSFDRTKAACVPCRERKRKCNGTKPCSTCTGTKRRCYYNEKHLPTAAVPTVETKSKSISDDVGKPERRHSSKVNSGFDFMRQLVATIDSKNAPQLQPTAWNIGSRFPASAYESSLAVRITDLLSHGQMLALADAYFEKVDPCYGFIERDRIFQQIGVRWVSTQSPSTSDALLCGIGALGSFFSMAVAVSVEPQLVQLAKLILETTSPSEALNHDIISAWVCRVIYLRVTSTPLSAWLASCTTMHLSEAAGLHLAAPSDENVRALPSSNNNPSTSRRAFGVAQHLNIWLSYELGVSRAGPAQPPIPSETPAHGNYTNQLLSLLPASLNLDPNQVQDDDTLISTLSALVNKQDKQPPLIMAQCNVILCILRRLYSRRSLRKDNEQVTSAALQFLSKGLAAARQMIEEDTPWHQLANVPFQTLCILIAVDTQVSLQLVSDAVQTIQKVAAAYNTVNMTEAYNTACLVLCMYYKRRSEDVRVIGDVLAKSIRPAQVSPSLSYDNGSVGTFTDNDEWVSNLMTEYPNLPDLDFDAMLNFYPQNMPGLVGSMETF